ncbi:hypothetical protein AMTRI_Chr02g218470 [Amborella trichopoda]
MRRMAAEFRRPVKRRLSRGFWIVLFGLVFVLLIVIFSHERTPEVNPLLSQVSIIPGLNITEEMVDPYSLTRQLGDQISLAKAFVVIAKESNNLQLAWELSAQILLSNAATRSSLLSAFEADTSIRDMSLLIHQAKQLHYDRATVIMKLKAQIAALEEQVNSTSIQSTTFGQLAAEAISKSLYFLGTKLTIEWFKNSKSRNPRTIASTTFCVFSDNLLSAFVVVNSTVLNANCPDLTVFHLVTDGVNFAAMKAWFSMNRFKQLQDSETQSYYFAGTPANKSPIKFRNPKYLSMLNHLRFYIPEVYPSLKKLAFLDDDLVVQKDLSPLLFLDLHGNVNGAVETCLETFHRYHKYLNFSHPLIRAHFDHDSSCIYHYWQERNVDRILWKLGTLAPGLLTFYALTEPLDPRWHVLGLNGEVVHYNGNMNPWLKIGMSKYMGLWEKYVDYSQLLLQQCNVALSWVRRS